MRRSIYILFLLLAVSVLDVSAQIDRREVRRGNRDFKKENYKEADIDYRRALVKDSTSLAANFNLANTLYRQGDYQQAAKVLERVKDKAAESEYAADYFYNVGNVAIALENWQGAVDALRESLLRRPEDLDAKENYIYAKKKLENQQNQQNQDNQNQDNKDNQDDKENQDNKDNQDNQDNKDDQDNKDNKDDKQDQQSQNDQQQDQSQNQQNQQGQQPKITPQAAQQMLQAIQAKEKETQDKVNKEKAKALMSNQKEKNW